MKNFTKTALELNAIGPSGSENEFKVGEGIDGLPTVQLGNGLIKTDADGDFLFNGKPAGVEYIAGEGISIEDNVISSTVKGGMYMEKITQTMTFDGNAFSIVFSTISSQSSSFTFV